MQAFKTVAQKFDSAETSINSHKLPAVFSKVAWRPGTVNADIGGGKFDNATAFLASVGVENLIFDPYNRTQSHNEQVTTRLKATPADTATCSNVLNVIAEAEAREQVIFTVSQAIKPDGVAYFTIYEGNKSGNGCETSKGWQENRTTKSYLLEIAKHFDSVAVKNGVIIAKLPKCCKLAKAV